LESESESMDALVTGAAGFIGSALCKELLRRGHSVVGVDSLTDYYDIRLKERNLAGIVSDRFTFHGDSLNDIDLASLLHGVDWVFHQAGQPGVRKSWGADFSTYVRENIEATQRLLEAVRTSRRLRRLIYASSSSIYGDASSFPTREDTIPRPISPYGVTKLAAENLCSLYAKNFGVPAVSLRYFTVYGPGQRSDMAFTRFIKAAVTSEPITVYGNGQQIRDFTYIDDVVHANVLAAEQDTEPGSIFNVAGGCSVSVNDVLTLLGEMMGEALRVEYRDMAAGDVRRTGGDTTQIDKVLHWKPVVGIDEGLGNQFKWGCRLFAAAPTPFLVGAHAR
jgi:nucleoside-diphosphate-sugar epimerase